MMRTGEKICWAIAALGVPALVATYSVTERLEYEEPARAVEEHWVLVPVPTSEGCPVGDEDPTPEAKMAGLFAELGSGSIGTGYQEDLCNNHTVSATSFVERDILIAHTRGAGVLRKVGLAEDTTAVDGVANTTTAVTYKGSCCAQITAGRVWKLNQDCEGSTADVRVCLYEEAY